MTMTDRDQHIREEFKRGDIEYIDAVLALQNLGWLGEDAEDQVTEWEEESP